MEPVQGVAAGPNVGTSAMQRGQLNGYQAATIARGGMLFAVCVILPFVCFVLRMQDANGVVLDSIHLLELIFGAIAAVCALAAIVLVPLLNPNGRHSVVLSGGWAGQSPVERARQRLLGRAMMSGALTEIPGLFGFILFIMGAEPLVYSAFVATSLVSSALTWPRKSQWERLAAEAPVGVPPLYDPAGAAVADPQVDFAAPQPSSDFAVSAAHSDFEQPAMSGEMGLQGRLLEEENQARAKFKMAVLVRGVSLAVVVALPVLAATLFTLTLRPRAFDESGMGMVIIFSAISAFCAIGALLLPQLMVPLTGPASSALAAPTSASASPLNQGVPGRLFARSAIAGGFTNIPALFGMILFVSFGIDLRLLAVFIAATIVSSLLTFPRWSAWDEARMEAVTYPPMG